MSETFHHVKLRIALTPVKMVDGKPLDARWLHWIVSGDELPHLLAIMDRNHTIPSKGHVVVDGAAVR